MSSEWRKFTLGDLTDWSSGGTPSKKNTEFWDGTIPWISASSMRSTRYSDSELKITSEGLKSGSRLAPMGSILLLVRGSILHQKIPVGITTKNVAFNQDVKGIQVKKHLVDSEIIDNWYLFYWLKANEKLLLSMVESTGIGAGKLDTKQLQELEVDVPSWGEQKQIVACCKAIEEKEIINIQINQTLEQMAQAIFKSWFVDFEPVKAKIAALEAGGNEDDALLAAMQAIAGSALFATDAADTDAPTQLARLQAEHPEQYATLRATAELFPSAMQESELGEIPEGWGVNKVSSQVDVLNGFAFKSADYVEKPGVFVLRTKNFNNIGIAEQQHDDVFLPEVFNVSHKKYLCEPYDYHLIMVGASVGKRGIIFPGNLPAIRNQNMWCFRPKLGADVGKAFTKYMVDELTSQKIGLASGSAREFFRKGDFQNQEICFANALIQKKFDEVVFPLLEKQAMNIAENEYLSNLRDSLLPKLLSGELSISAAIDQITQAEEAIDV